MSLTNRSVLRDYVALSELNYIYPFGTLPTNNFFRRIRPNPYYLANELRNININLERKPTVYQCLPSVDVQKDARVPKWADSFGVNKANVILEEASKSLVGPYFDTINNQAGVQYNYEFVSKLSMICPVATGQGYVILGFNLLNKPVPSVFTTNMVKYVKIGCPPLSNAECPCLPKEESLNPCETIESSPQGHFTPAINGEIKFFGKDKRDMYVCNLAGAVPHLECPDCGLDQDVYYAVIGKRLYIACKLPEVREWEIDTAMVRFGASIVEESTPTLFSSLGSV